MEYLDPKDNGVYIDATVGMGGHAEMILSGGRNIKLIGIDQDTEALSHAETHLSRFGNQVRLAHANFAKLSEVAEEEGLAEVDGIIADLGVSSLQFDSETRGFSFRFDSPLDMRMDRSAETDTAADLLRDLSEVQIANLIYEFGEERFSRRIARRIVERRREGKPVETTRELADLVARAVPRRRKDKLHPATKTFQALRIAVNNELGILEQFIRDAAQLLKHKGRLVVIAFHSLEDRIVKRTMQNLSGKCFCPPKIPKCICGRSDTLRILTKKPVVPTQQETDANPRARSAKLRACEKLALK